MEIFGEVIPPQFINQDGDPYLFELYKRWGASKFLSGPELKNEIGGLLFKISSMDIWLSK